MLKPPLVLLGAVLGGLVSAPVLALPLADVELRYVDNHDGTWTYAMTVTNAGPVALAVATPGDYVLTSWQMGDFEAGGRLLNQDENIVSFGIDTGTDEVNVFDLRAGESSFHGTLEDAWQDHDGDGIPNVSVAWHLPFYDWTLDEAILPRESLSSIRFTTDRKLEKVVFWAVGSDDTVIWHDSHLVVEDPYGIYDTVDGQYLATFFGRALEPQHVHSRRLCLGTGFGKQGCLHWPPARDRE